MSAETVAMVDHIMLVATMVMQGIIFLLLVYQGLTSKD
jgi:hypothetical protein